MTRSDAPWGSEVYLDTKQAAAYCNLHTRTLKRWRSTGAGPRFIKQGRKVLYRLSDLEAWMAEHCYTNTAAAAEGLSEAVLTKISEAA